jgi:hypothetical protein
MTTLMNVGCPHFEGELRKYRQADYNIYKSLYEFIDNIINKCSVISLTFKFIENEILEIRISDNYTEGFKDIGNNKTNNPFNMSHMRPGQENDKEMSQFGIGMKAGAISLAQKMNIFTRVKDRFYDIEMDFLEMSKREDPMESFNPKQKEKDIDEYNENHPFDYGSTIILSNIRKTMYSYLNESEAINDLIKNISFTYSEILEKNEVVIRVNDIKVEPIMSFFKEKECIPYNRECKIFRLYNKETRDIIYIGFYGKESKIYNKVTKRLNKIKEGDIKKIYLEKGYEYAYCFNEKELECIKIQSTFTMYHPLMMTKDEAAENMPRNRILIYRDGRLYGNWHNEKSNDGCGNFTDTRIDFKSKVIAKNLGLTFNKNISQSLKNELSNVVKQFFLELKRGFNASTDSKANEKLYDIAIENNLSVCKGGNDEDNVLIDRRPVKSREPKEQKPKPKPEPVKIYNEQILRLFMNSIHSFNKYKLEDYNLEKAKKIEANTKLYESIFILNNLLKEYLK